LGGGMKVYTGIRDGEDCFVRVLPLSPAIVGGQAGPEPYLLPERPDLLRDWLADLLPESAAEAGEAAQGPRSFCWGEAGPGADHLALAIAVDVAAAASSAEESAAWLAGLPFLRRFLSHLPSDGFEIADTVFAALLKAGAPPTSAGAGAPRTRRWMEVVGR
jgi:hypothetical protein